MPRPKTRVRWEVEWIVQTPNAKKRQAADPQYEHNHDVDEQAYFKIFDTHDKAQAYARQVVDQYETVYGHATVQEQQFLPIEDTGHWDWENVGDTEYVE